MSNAFRTWPHTQHTHTHIHTHLVHLRHKLSLNHVKRLHNLTTHTHTYTHTPSSLDSNKLSLNHVKRLHNLTTHTRTCTRTRTHTHIHTHLVHLRLTITAIWCFYWQHAAKCKTAGIVFTHRAKTSIFTPQGRLVPPTQMKFCMAESVAGRSAILFHRSTSRYMVPKLSQISTFDKDFPA